MARREPGAGAHLKLLGKERQCPTSFPLPAQPESRRKSARSKSLRARYSTPKGRGEHFSLALNETIRCDFARPIEKYFGGLVPPPGYS